LPEIILTLKELQMSMWSKTKSRLIAFHNDEKGADMVEYILIVAAIALPLLAVAIYFWKDLKKQVWDWWDSIKGDTAVSDNPG
jgi:Flp pilus assembly pilin Flp